MRVVFVALLLLFASPALATPPNIILVVLDDVTACWIGKYSTDFAECSEAFTTTAIDTFASSGVTVSHAWGQPVCSPYRSSILTGTQPREHGVGRAVSIVNDTGRRGLNAIRPNLARSLEAGGYDTRVFGKWHLANREMGESAMIGHPIAMGFGGGNGTLGQTNQTTGGATDGDYTNWQNCDFSSGSCVTDTDYATTQIIDDIFASVASPLTEPWFIYAPFQAAHAPQEKPPDALHTNSTDCDNDLVAPDLDEVCFARSIEAASAEIGRLIAAYDSSDTILIITADNGTPSAIANATNASWAAGRCKGSVAECGLWVPLIVGGVGIDTGTADILVSATDLHATILELAGVDNPGAGWNTGSMGPSLGGRDYQYRSVSFAANLKDASLPSRRSCIYAERFEPDATTGLKTNWHEGIRSATHKLMRHNDTGETYAEEFFLTSSIYEVAPTDHLALSGADYDFLSAAMDAMNASGGDPCR